MVKYIFFSSCTKSLEPYNWLKLIVKLVPPVPPPSSTSSSRESSSSTSIPSLLRLLCPLSRLCHVVLCNLVQEGKDVLGCLHQLGPAFLNPQWGRAVLKPHMLCPGKRHCEKENGTKSHTHTYKSIHSPPSDHSAVEMLEILAYLKLNCMKPNPVTTDQPTEQRRY